jgi:ABC-type branched-subunit amino acid transport system substrate-binding protein
MSSGVIRIGGLGPLSPPGIPWAGRELLDGMHLAVTHINKAGGIEGRTAELVFEDTQGSPAAGLDAVSRLVRRGVHACVGEYHSTVAHGILGAIARSGLPFVCSSATLDAITSSRVSNVFRLSSPQSYGWRAYASYIAHSGVNHVFAVMENSPYWKAGADVIESTLSQFRIQLTRVEIDSGGGILRSCDELKTLVSETPPRHMLLLLVAYPEMLSTVLQQIRAHNLVTPSLSLGDPAGRTIFEDWWAVAGEDAVGIPFLAYERPGQLTERGVRAAEDFEREYDREPSFVALEGYDAVLSVAAAMSEIGSTDPVALCSVLKRIGIQGTRGTIHFSTEAEGVVHQQWKWPPTCVVAFQHPHQRFSNAQVLWEA